MTVAGLSATKLRFLEEAAYERFWRLQGRASLAYRAGKWDEAHRLHGEAAEWMQRHRRLRGAA